MTDESKTTNSAHSSVGFASTQIDVRPPSVVTIPIPSVAQQQADYAIASYKIIQQQLLVDFDKVYDIRSHFYDIGRGVASPAILFQRNTLNAIPLDKRVPPDKNIALIRYNAELRTLGTLRGLTHVLAYAAGLPTNSAQAAYKDIHLLRLRFETFQKDIEAAYKKGEQKKAKKGPSSVKKKKAAVILGIASGVALLFALLIALQAMVVAEAMFFTAVITSAVITTVLVTATLLTFRSAKQDDKKSKEGNPKQLAKEVNRLEEAFNLDLLRYANRHGFLKGIENDPKALNQFLSYCRFSAGSLDVAPIVETAVRLVDKTNKELAPTFYTETCYPLTAKLDEQRVDFNQAINGKTGFFATMPPYQQLVTRAFQTQFAENAHGLSPQMRGFIPHFLKQAFVVERRVEVEGIRTVTWAARTGTIAYVGREADKDELSQQPAAQNLQQLKHNIAATVTVPYTCKRVHLRVLNSDTDVWYRKPFGKLLQDRSRQDLMVKRARQAVEKSKEGDKISILGVNPEGRVTPPFLSGFSTAKRYAGMLLVILGAVVFLSAPLWALLITTGGPSLLALLSASTTEIMISTFVGAAFALGGAAIMAVAGWWVNLGNPFSVSSRIVQAVALGLEKNLSDEEIIAVSCASGCDRTGTQTLLASIKEVSQRTGRSEKEVARCLVAGGHNAVMAHILCPGSYGMKHDSMPGNYFGSLTKFLFLKSAKTNKEVPLFNSAAKAQKRSAQRWGLLMGAVFAAIIVGLLWSPPVFTAFSLVVTGLPVTSVMPVLAVVLGTLAVLAICGGIYAKYKDEVARAFCKVTMGIAVVVSLFALIGAALFMALLSTVAALGVLIAVIHRFTDDLVSAVGWIAGAVVVLTIAAFAVVPAVAGFAMWQSLANFTLFTWASAAFSPPIFSFIVMGVAALGLGREMGGAAGKDQAKTAFLAAVEESPSVPKTNVVQVSYGNPALRRGSLPTPQPSPSQQSNSQQMQDQSMSHGSNHTSESSLDDCLLGEEEDSQQSAIDEDENSENSQQSPMATGPP